MNAGRHTENITRGARLFSEYFWQALRSIPVNFPVAFFYTCMTPLLVYLRYETNQTFGLDIYEQSIGLPWWTLIILFGFCGLITAQQRSPIVYGLATLPMLFYAGLLAHGIIVELVSPVGLTAIVYLTTGTLAVLGTLRYSIELEFVSRSLIAAQKTLEENAREIVRLKEMTSGSTTQSPPR